MASSRSTPPSTATATSFAARPSSVSLAEAAEAFAAFGLGGGAARGVEHLRAALRRDRGGEIGELLRLDREDLVAGLCRLPCTGRRPPRRAAIGRASCRERVFKLL